MVSNIDCSNTSNWNYNNELEFYECFKPIGNETHPFNGSLDGQGNIIQELVIVDYEPNLRDLGLFGFIKNGIVRNMTLDRAYIYEGRGYVGILAGRVEKTEVVSISAKGDVQTLSCEKSLGGLIGMANESNISSVLFSGSVGSIGYTGIGGIVGYALNSRINYSSSLGQIESKEVSGLGGLIGNAERTNISLSWSNMVVGDNETHFSGGLVGKMNKGIINNSYFSGTVRGSVDVGGLVGGSSESTISNSYATGNVTGTGNHVGGLAGICDSSNITNAYATGSVTGTYDYIGGLVGESYFSTITNSYYDTNTTGRSDIGKGVGLSTTQMKNHSNFIGWDFETIWDDTLDGSEYPTFRWQNKANLSKDYIQINLSEGWNLFSISRNYTNNNTDRNITLKKGFNFVGYSGNNSLLNFTNNVKINGNDWDSAVSREIVSSYVMGFGNNGNRFYAPFIPSSISKNQGYIIYSFSNESVNMTINGVFGNDNIEYRLKNIRAKNSTGTYFFEDVYEDWFYPIGENKTGVYEYNRTVDGSETYNELELDAKLNSWESYWIRTKYDTLSLVIYG